MLYSGRITETSNVMSPFLVTITDEEGGRLFGTFPASTRPEAEARLIEVLSKLHDVDRKKLKGEATPPAQSSPVCGRRTAPMPWRFESRD